MNLKKQFIFLLALLLLFPLFSINVSAAEAPEFRYELTIDGLDTVEAESGDLLTVTLHLYRTDEDADYTMYAMQNEIRYNSDFFELVEDSPQLYKGVQSTDIQVAEDLREFYMSFLSMSGGENWKQKTRVGTFQLRVTGTAGTTTITNEDFLVSLPDGSGSYKCEGNTLTVILSTECIIKFESNGGTPIDPITAIYGEKIVRPEDPTRDGKHFAGWYKDIHLTQEWNFETDTVTGNMTLYAKWMDEAVKGPSINMDWLNKIPIVPIIIVLGVLLLLWFLLRFLIILIGNRRYVMYSLVNGDVKLNYRNDNRKAKVTVVLEDENTSHVLGEIDATAEEKIIRYIENKGKMEIVQINPGIYGGKLIVKDDYSVLTSVCRIKVIDKELKYKK